MTSQVNGFTEIQSKPYRMYYKDDWRCQCGNHSIETYEKILNSIFHTKSAHYSNDKNWKGEREELYHVEANADCLLMSNLREIEFHGLMLSSMFATYLSESMIRTVANPFVIRLYNIVFFVSSLRFYMVKIIADSSKVVTRSNRFSLNLPNVFHIYRSIYRYCNINVLSMTMSI